jgi:hypothetical protein
LGRRRRTTRIRGGREEAMIGVRWLNALKICITGYP